MSNKAEEQNKELTQLIKEIIDEGANTAEEINRAVLDLPVTVLDRLGLENTANDVKQVQDSSIGAIYRFIHDINHRVADLATELLEQRDEKAK